MARMETLETMQTTQTTGAMDVRRRVSGPLSEDERRALDKLPLTGTARRVGPLDTLWMTWCRVSGPPDVPAEASVAERERVRLARVASVIILCIMVIGLLALPVTRTGDGLFRIGLLLAADAAALACNRGGKVLAAGILLVLSTEVGAISSFLLAPGGMLGVMAISLYGLYIVPDLIAAALLPPLTVVLLGAANSIFIVLDMLLQPHDATLGAVLAPNAYIIVERPIAMQLFVAILMYIWVRIALSANRRADYAEVVARMQQREAELLSQEAERSRTLDEGAAHLQVILTQLANGNFHARVPTLRDPRLWQVGKGLNHFIGRLERFAQAEFMLQREQEEAQRLAAAILEMRRGQQPLWPAPSGTPLDTVIGALRGPLPATDDTAASGLDRSASERARKADGMRPAPTGSHRSERMPRTTVPMTPAVADGAPRSTPIGPFESSEPHDSRHSPSLPSLPSLPPLTRPPSLLLESV